MTEDDEGRIWSVTYPNSAVASFEPGSQTFRDYGALYDQNWPQYQRSVAADDQGFVYFAIGNTLSQIIALDPASGEATPVIEESDRVQGTARVVRDENGRVYGQISAVGGQPWFELYGGKRLENTCEKPPSERTYIAGSQGLFHRAFPDGSHLEECNLVDRLLRVKSPSGEVVELPFDYESEGAHLMGLAAAPHGPICGGTAFPMRFFQFDPETGEWENRPGHCQWNTVAAQGDRFFVGEYIQGILMEWDPSQPWVDTDEANPASNPKIQFTCKPDIYRPHALLAHSDGKTIVMGGTPDYGYTGGGLLFWDRESETGELIKHAAILPEHSTMSLAELDNGKLLGGSTTAAGTGGERKAEVAELYVIDMKTKEIEWHEAAVEGASEYSCLKHVPSGMVYGMVNNATFIVFDPETRNVVHQYDTSTEFNAASYQQGQRRIVTTPDGNTYLLLQKGIVKVDPATYALKLVAESPVPIGPGGDYLDGRIYFASGSHLYSYMIGSA